MQRAAWIGAVSLAMALLCTLVYITTREKPPVASTQIATASGPCSVAINAAYKAVVSVNLDCDAETAKIVQRLLDDEARFKSDVLSLYRRVSELSRVVQTVRQAAASPQASVQLQQAAAQLQLGQVDATVALLEQEAHGSAHRVAELYRQQATLLRVKDVRRALAALERALNFEPDDFNTLWHAGDLARVAGNTAQAQRFYERMSQMAERNRALSLDSTGTAWLAVGRVDASLQSHRAALQIRQNLAKADPQNPRWQCDVALSQERLGDLHYRQGQLTSALQHHRAALDIRQRYAQSHPNEREWQKSLAMSHQKIGEVQADQGNSHEALNSQTQAMTLRRRVAERDQAPSRDTWSPIATQASGSTACW